MQKYEKKLWSKGYRLIAGIDEVGRGPLAGPVVAAAVILSPYESIDNLRDSKKLSEKKRDEIFLLLPQKSLGIGIGVINEEIIDRINILQATYLAMKQAIFNLKQKPDYLLVDGFSIPQVKIPQLALKNGDNLSSSIAAASIVAKVTRDKIMKEFDKQYPPYGFASHKGYGTVYHLEALSKYGACEIHRKSFHPVKKKNV